MASSASASSGLLHALLAIDDRDALYSHPVVSASWEGYVVENLLGLAPEEVTAYFYRTSGGAEIDLLLSLLTTCLGPALDRVVAGGQLTERRLRG